MNLDAKLKNLFNKLNVTYFEKKLANVDVSWSDKMTLCTGKTYLQSKGEFRFCRIKLSNPLLCQRSFEDTVNTLAHEMIHAYLFLTKAIGQRESHGQDFIQLMKFINLNEGTKIQIRHNFHKEVNKFRIHIYKCDGPCRHRRPFYGIIRRAITRPPGPKDHWWDRHVAECGGTFIKTDGKNISSDLHSKPKTLSPNKIGKPEKQILNRNFCQSGRTHFTAKHRLVTSNVNVRYKTQLTKYTNVFQKYLNNFASWGQTKYSSFSGDEPCMLYKPNDQQAVPLNAKFPINKYIDKLNIYRSQTNYCSSGITDSGDKSQNKLKCDGNDNTNLNKLGQSKQIYIKNTRKLNGKKHLTSSDNEGFSTLECPVCSCLVITGEYNFHIQVCKDSFSNLKIPKKN